MASEIVIPLGLCFRIESVLLNKYPYAYCDLLVFYLLCPCICILHFSLIIFWGKIRACENSSAATDKMRTESTTNCHSQLTNYCSS